MALFDIAGADGPADPYHLGFLVGPRINAGGRIGDAGMGARLLSLRDEEQARASALTLDRLNRERQALEAAALEQAEADALLQVGLNDAGHEIIVVAGQAWHPGIVGIVAGRLREKFGRPAFAIALGHAGGTGSGRSVLGVDLGRAVRAAVENGVLAKGGGHAMAAGVTLGVGGLSAFQSFMETELRAAAQEARATDALAIDATVTAGAAVPALLDELDGVGPYGSGSPEPCMALPSHRIADAAPIGSDHVRLRLASGDGATVDAIAFRAASEPLGRALLASKGLRMHVAGTLMRDRWGGRERVRLRLLDASPA